MIELNQQPKKDLEENVDFILKADEIELKGWKEDRDRSSRTFYKIMGIWTKVRDDFNSKLEEDFFAAHKFEDKDYQELYKEMVRKKCVGTAQDVSSDHTAMVSAAGNLGLSPDKLKRVIDIFNRFYWSKVSL